MTFPDPCYAMVPAAIFVSLHLVEANVLTPTLVGAAADDQSAADSW